MGKSTHFLGQPVYGQVINLLDKSKILQISRENGGEHYVKSFDAWFHMTTMLYGVIQRFDSLREIEISLQAEARKLLHVGLSKPPSNKSNKTGPLPRLSDRRFLIKGLSFQKRTSVSIYRG